MFIDARTLPNQHTIETDICIIGAGAAGITIARQFIGLSTRVCVLESGGFESEADSQLLAHGLNAGLPYYPLIAARLRYFGGTTNHWAAYCRPFHDLDFETRAWVPHSGWPLSRSDLAFYYEDAGKVCQLPTFDWNTDAWQKQTAYPLLPLLGDRVVSRPVQIIHPKIFRRFGKVYREELRQATNITTYLYANTTELETDEVGKTVTRVHAACLSGTTFSVTARQIVLAAGGIENPRLLLLSNRRQPAGLGNQHDVVGRFFLEHPRFVAGLLQPTDPSLSVRFYQPHRGPAGRLRGYLSLPEELQRQEQLVDVQVRLIPEIDERYASALESRGVTSLKHLLQELWQKKTPDDLGKHVRNVVADIDDIASSTFWWARFRGEYPLNQVKLITRVEQAPNPQSRVTLADERDQLGLRRAQLHWHLSPIDKHSIRRTLEIIGMECGRAGLGRVKILLSDDDTTWPSETRGGYHHMGTTRMHDDSKQGVVDRNCQIHGLSNVFVAGSSVFPTSGSGTPTLLLIALALRLADHLKERMI